MTTTTTITQLLFLAHILSPAQSRHALFSILKKFTQIFLMFFQFAQKAETLKKRCSPSTGTSSSCTHPPPCPPPLKHFSLPCQMLQQQAINYPNTKLHFTFFFNVPKCCKKAQVAFGFLKHFLLQFHEANLLMWETSRELRKLKNVLLKLFLIKF